MIPETPTSEATGMPPPDDTALPDGVAADGASAVAPPPPVAEPPADLSGAVEGPFSAADGIKNAVTLENRTIGGLIESLDSYAIDVGTAHISIWGAMVVLMILAGVILAKPWGRRSPGLLWGRKCHGPQHTNVVCPLAVVKIVFD